jgi:hypothetical protein
MIKRFSIVAIALLGALVFWAPAALAQTAACTTAGYADAYDVCSSSNPANQPSTTVTSSQAVQAAVSQTAGLVASRISGFSASSSAPGQALRPQNHRKVLALGRDGTMLNGKSKAPAVASYSDSGKIDGIGPNYHAETNEDDMRGLAAGGAPTKFGVWLDAAWSRLIFSKTNENFDGEIMTGMLGADYMVTKDLLLGVAGGYEVLDLDTESNRGSIDGTGWTVSPYAAYKLSDNLSVDVSGGYSWLEYDLVRLDPGDNSQITGTQDADRWFASANLSADKWYDQFHVGGKLGVLHAEEDKDDFTESNLTNQAGAATNVGMGYVGLRLGYLIPFEAGSIEPYVSVLGRGAYDDGGSGDSVDGVVGLGAAVNYGALQLGVSGTSVVGRDNTENFTGRVNARIEF